MEKLKFYPEILLKIDEDIIKFYRKKFPNKKINRSEIYNAVSSKQTQIIPLWELLIQYKVTEEKLCSKHYCYNPINKARKLIKQRTEVKETTINVCKKIFGSNNFYKLLGYRDLKDFLNALLLIPGMEEVVKKQAKLLNIELDNELAQILGKYQIYYLDRYGEVSTGICQIEFNKNINKPYISMILYRKITKTKELFLSIPQTIELNDKILSCRLKGETHSPFVQIHLTLYNKFLISSYTTFDNYSQKFENGYILLKKLKSKNQIINRRDSAYIKTLLLYLNKVHTFNLNTNKLFTSRKSFETKNFKVYFRQKREFIAADMEIISFASRWIYARLKYMNKKYHGFIIHNELITITFHETANILSREIITLKVPKSKIYLNFFTGMIILSDNLSVESAKCIITQNKKTDNDLLQKIKLYLNGNNLKVDFKSFQVFKQNIDNFNEIIKEFIGYSTLVLASSSKPMLYFCPIYINNNMTFLVKFNTSQYKGFINIYKDTLKLIIADPYYIDIYATFNNKALIGIYSGINYIGIMTSGKLLILPEAITEKTAQVPLDKDIKPEYLYLIKKYHVNFEYFTISYYDKIKFDSPSAYEKLKEILKKI